MSNSRPGGFGARLRKLRKERGLSQTDLAQASNISTASISSQETSTKCHLLPDNMRQVVTALNNEHPLEESDLNFFRNKGSLSISFRLPPTRQGSPEQMTRLTAQYKGQMRDLLDAIHQQVKEEADKEKYLRELLRVASRLKVRLTQLPELGEELDAGSLAEAAGA